MKTEEEKKIAQAKRSIMFKIILLAIQTVVIFALFVVFLVKYLSK